MLSLRQTLGAATPTLSRQITDSKSVPRKRLGFDSRPGANHFNDLQRHTRQIVQADTLHGVHRRIEGGND